jgi:hypothetical protein
MARKRALCVTQGVHSLRRVLGVGAAVMLAASKDQEATAGDKYMRTVMN